MSDDMPIKLISIDDDRPLPWWELLEYSVYPARSSRGSEAVGVVPWHEPERRYLLLRMNSAKECEEHEYAWGAAALVIEYELPGAIRRHGLFVCDKRTTTAHTLRLLEIERLE